MFILLDLDEVLLAELFLDLEGALSTDLLLVLLFLLVTTGAFLVDLGELAFVLDLLAVDRVAL